MRLPSRLRTSRSRRAGSGSHDGAPRTSCASPSRARIPVARLGGHITNNGAPGWQVLGTRPRPRVLLLMELGWRAAQTSPPGDVIDDEHRSHRGGSRKRDHRPGTILARRDPLGSAYLYLAAGGSLLVGGIPFPGPARAIPFGPTTSFLPCSGGSRDGAGGLGSFRTSLSRYISLSTRAAAIPIVFLMSRSSLRVDHCSLRASHFGIPRPRSPASAALGAQCPGDGVTAARAARGTARLPPSRPSARAWRACRSRCSGSTREPSRRPRRSLPGYPTARS